jgi:TM2 domain-containing membrane protein YozV
MALRGRAAVAVLAALALPASAARAQQPPPAPYAPPPPSTPPPPYYAPPPSPYPNYPYSQQPAPGAPSPQQLTIYENESKSHAVALLLNWLFPGLGSIYADHAVGAFVTWAGIGGGVALVVIGANNTDTQMSHPGETLIIAGAVMIVGFSIYSWVDAWSSVTDYNETLAARIGLTAANLGVTPIVTPHGQTWGPSLTLRF